MPDEIELPTNKHVTELYYKSRGGSLKVVYFSQSLDPDQRTLSLRDIQILGREIAKKLQEDAL